MGVLNTLIDYVLSLMPSFLLVLFQNALKVSIRLISFKYSKQLYKFKGEYCNEMIGKYPTEYLMIASQRKDGGQQEEEEEQKKSEDEITIVLIPGNPGHVRFYDAYLSELAQQLNYAHNIYAVGHVGHSKYTRLIGKDPIIHEGQSVLGEQIQHKTEFVRFLMNKHKQSKFIFISHSIGSYITLHLIDRLPRDRIIQSYNLFPTIEKMNDVPNYKSANASTSLLGRYFIAVFAAGISKLVPTFIQRAIIDFVVSNQLQQKESVDDIVETVLGFLDYSTVLNLSVMAQNEFKEVRERQNKLLYSYLDLLTFYYGVQDGWAPLHLQQQIQNDFPSLKTIVDKDNLEHAFVVGGARKMAQITSKWIK